jgi:tetratricopeptide (TPR) repeat protein
MKIGVRKHLEYASGYLDLKMYEETLREADAALALQPDEPHALALKSSALWRADRLREAEPFVEKLAALHPRDAGIWINLAYIRRRTQSLDAAVATLQHAFDANPRDALAHFNMACYRAVQNRPDEAMEELRSALRLEPKLKGLARVEPDLRGLREMPEFGRLVNGRCSRLK